MLQGFLGCKRQELAFFIDTRDLHVRIHHRLGQKRGPLAALGRRAKLFSYVRDSLLFYRLRGRAGLSHLHWRCGADGSSVGHDDLLGSQTDQGAGGDRSLVHEGHRLNPSVQQRVADHNRGIHPPTESINVENDRRRACILRLVKNALNERREAEVNDPLDWRDVDHGGLALSGEQLYSIDGPDQRKPDEE